MACDRIPLKGGGAVVICSRGQRSPARKCSVAGCTTPSGFQCDFKLSGEKSGKTCDKYLCRAHAVTQALQLPATVFVDPGEALGGAVPEWKPGMFKPKPVTLPLEAEPDTIDYCPAHDRMTRGAPP